ncbi:MAG: hypothetical protein U0V70_00155 [Terriglobia bacterium]
MSEIFKTYVFWQVLGGIVVICACVAQHFEKKRSSERLRDESKALREELRQAKQDLTDQSRKHANSLADLVVARIDIDKFREKMQETARNTVIPPPAKLQEMNVDLAKVDHQIAKALEQIPQELKDAYGREKMAEGEEALAQARAKTVNAEIRPRFMAVLTTIREIVQRAGAQQLVELDSIQEMQPIPDQIVFSKFELDQSKRPQNDAEKGFRVIVKNGRNLVVSIQYGLVKSPTLKAPWFDAPTDIYYPMVRIATLGVSTTTIYFHQETKALTVEHDADKQLREKLLGFTKDMKEHDAVAAIILELLRVSRVAGKWPE